MSTVERGAEERIVQQKERQIREAEKTTKEGEEDQINDGSEKLEIRAPS